MKAKHVRAARILWVAVLIPLGAAPSQRAATASEKVLRAGAYAIDVTPTEFPVLVNGHFSSREATKIIDPLHARCLVLDDGAERIAIVVVDSCMLPRTLLDEAKRLAAAATQIDADRITISATHTHSAPAAMGCLGTDADLRYAATLPRRIADGIRLAERNLAPARIGWAVGKSDENVFCRRFLMKSGTAPAVAFTGKANDQAQMNPGFQNQNSVRRTGAADTDVSVVSVQTRDGQPIAVLANYSTHYAGAPAISADYFGVFAERIAELIGAKDTKPAFVGMMTNGTSGDTNCIDFTRPRRHFDRFSVANDVAADAFKAYQRIGYSDWAPVAMEETVLCVAVRMPSGAEVAAAKQHLRDNVPAGNPSRQVDVYARETVLLSQMPATRELKLQAIRIGDLGIATIPNEVFSSTGLRIKAESPTETTFTIELANGAEGYIPPPAQHALGGYTTWRARSSCLEVEAEPKIAAAVLALLHRVSTEHAPKKAALSAPATETENGMLRSGELLPPLPRIVRAIRFPLQRP